MGKSWPKDETKTVPMEELVNPVAKLYLQCHRSPNKDFVYEGYDHGTHCGATCLGGDDWALAKNRHWAREDQGRSITETFMSLAFQLGFEQGMRHKASESEMLKLALAAQNREVVAVGNHENPVS